MHFDQDNIHLCLVVLAAAEEGADVMIAMVVEQFGTAGCAEEWLESEQSCPSAYMGN